MRCKDCYSKDYELTHGRCRDCHLDVLECFGELYLLSETLASSGPESYQYKDPDTIYAYFHRMELRNGVIHVMRNERRWCLRVHYKQGYPCAPRLVFVNALDHTDDNPIWWPKTKFKLDPVRQLFDLDCVDEHTAMYLPVEKMIPLHRWSPSHYVGLIAPQILPIGAMSAFTKQ